MKFEPVQNKANSYNQSQPDFNQQSSVINNKNDMETKFESARDKHPSDLHQAQHKARVTNYA